MNRWVELASASLAAAMLLAVQTDSALAAEPLSLARAIERALAANPTLHGHEAAVRKQALESDIARGQRWPKLDLNASYTHNAYPTLVTPIREPGVFPPLDRDISTVGLALSLPLYAGGKLVAAESLASHDREAATEALRGARQDLLFNVTATYTKALHLRDLQTAAAARVRSLEAEEAHIAQRLAQGRAAKLELIRLQTQLSQARHDLLVATQGERDALSLLAALMGTRDPLPSLVDVAPTRIALPQSRDEALGKALDRRPDLLRAQALAKAANDQVAIAKGERKPQINLIAKAQESAGSDWRGYDDALIGVQMTVPLFDASIRRNRVAQAELERSRSELQVEQTLNELTAEVEQALGAVTESRARLDVARQSEVEAGEALRIESARYANGESTITDLLSAEAALWGARVQRLQAGYDITTSQARVLRAIGELSPGSFASAAEARAAEGEGSAGGLDELNALHRRGFLRRWGIGSPQGAMQ